MRELRVEDALLYLDQVKMEFGDRPHIYNEFLDIMKTFKTQQLDTPGVIRRVSTLFQGNRKLVLGFNTFLPEGYKIELPLDGNGAPVAVYRAPGQSEVVHILGPAASAQAPPGMTGAASGPPRPQPPQQGPPQMMGQQQQPGRGGAMMGMRPGHPQQQQGQPPGPPQGGMPVDQRQRSDSYQQQMHSQQHQMQQGRPQPPQQQQMVENRMQQQQPMQHPSRPPPHGQGGPPPQGPPQMQPQQPMQQMAPGQLPQGQQQQQGSGQAPVEFDHAINYVTTIKKRFANEPDIYKKFLEILHTYQKEQRGIKEVLDEVSVLFADHPDLLKEFTYFLPDAVQAQAKAQLDAVAKESEARLRARASKQAIMQTAQGMQRQTHGGLRQGTLPGGIIPRSGAPVYSPAPIPFGATQGRSDDREREICRSSVYGSVMFAPVRPPRRNELSVAQAAVKNGRPAMIPDLPRQPTTAESAFFERAKLHLQRRELAPDKPPGSKRHTPYTEFLKCMHLFGAGILNKEELVLLLRGLFMQGHAPKSGVNAGGGASNPAVASDAIELLREFEEVLIGRGPYAEQENDRKAKSKYGSISRRDFDYSHSEHLTPSYYSVPPDYPKSLFVTHSGQTEDDSSVLNDSMLCVVPQSDARQRYIISPEQYDGIKARRNVHEEAMFKVEDERFEADMAIERNLSTMRQVEPMADEVTRLRDIEEKEGQPIGRMTYKLRSRSLNNTQIHAIARLYGDKGDEVVQHLMKNPVAVLPIVYRRLRQKDTEWRRVKSEMAKEWNSINEANYQGSLDVLCSTYKKELEGVVSPESLSDDVKKTRQLFKNPPQDHPASLDWAYPEYALSSPEREEVLYQPHVRVLMNAEGFPHKDVFQLVSLRTLKGMFKTNAERERVARVWAEFMSPWFGYPSNWVADELRESYQGDDSSCTVKYAPGQRVQTCYGDGVIISRIAPGSEMGLRYKVKLGSGTAYLRPSSIVHILPAEDPQQRMVRRNGIMEKISLAEEGSDGGVDKRFQLMFATEKVYHLVRIYSFLTYALFQTRQALMLSEGGNKKKETQAPNGIGSTFEKSDSNDKASIATHDYAGVISALKKLIAGEVDIQAYESFCRKTTKDKVYLLVALPRLIDRCAEALVKVAKEDHVLSLYDLAQLKIMNPERLRVLSQSEVAEALYRIQFDTVEGFECFGYLAPGKEVLLAPDEEIENEETEAMEEEVIAEVDKDGDTTMEDGDVEADGRDTKRQKLDNGSEADM